MDGAMKLPVGIEKMDQACRKALSQMKDRRYQEYLRNDDRSDILLYGIAFCKKRCKVLVERNDGNL